MYEPLIRQLVELPFPSLCELAKTPDQSLAIMILLDQISRNSLRGPAAIYVYQTCDPVALKFSYYCMEQGHDKGRAPHKTFWYYMPLGHSENLGDQELSLARNAQLANDVRNSEEWKAGHGSAEVGLDHAIKFYGTIKKFGRFPSRNAIWGRETTAEEKEFMEKGGWGFGFTS